MPCLLFHPSPKIITAFTERWEWYLGIQTWFQYIAQPGSTLGTLRAGVSAWRLTEVWVWSPKLETWNVAAMNMASHMNTTDSVSYSSSGELLVVSEFMEWCIRLSVMRWLRPNAELRKGLSLALWRRVGGINWGCGRGHPPPFPIPKIPQRAAVTPAVTTA